MKATSFTFRAMRHREFMREPFWKLPIALSFDHRVIDGADAARFARWIAEALEQPFRLTLEG